MMRAYIGLGANLGDREAMLRRAVELLGAEPGVEVVAVSALRETDPVGYLDQPRFLNGAVAVETELEPRELLERLLAVERALGRERTGPRFGPRTVDLDLLVFGDRTVDEPGLTVPHPRLAERLVRARAARRARSRPDPAGRPTGRRSARAELESRHVAPRRARRVRGRPRAPPEEGIHGRLQPLSLLRRHAGLDVSLQPPRPEVAAADELPVLPAAMEDVWVWDKNRPSPDHPAGRGLHLERRDGRGAPRRGRRARV